MSKRNPGPLPDRWLKCPRKATGLFVNKFLAFKTPLGPHFNDLVPEGNRFTPSMLFDFMKSLKVHLGLWVDLTNTSRFYDKKEIEDRDCVYMKLQCRGHGETPSPEQTKEFILKVDNFVRQKPLEVIGVHCTHGFNRTGFLLVSYMVEQLDCCVDAAIKEFAKIRPPGIYKQDYIEELFRRYDDVAYALAPPPRPEWCMEEEVVDYDDTPSNSQDTQNSKPHKRKGKRETTHKKDIFMPGVQGVDPFDKQPRLREVQEKTQRLCEWKSTGFPGSQPVSMDRNNLWKLHEKPYRVSWKADGVRYMMLIDGHDEVYMLDRDNCVFKVHGLQFPHRKDLNRHLKDTLLDGEMVVDKVDGHSDVMLVHRYLVYDIIHFEGKDVGKARFYPDRLTCIQHEIINPRHQAMKQGIIQKDLEPFSVRLKEFWDVTMAHKLLGEKFAKTLAHEPDGLIFQPAKEPYVPGQCDEVLKWKPGDMNSVDFKLKIVTEGGVGILPKKIGCLYVGRLNTPFSTIKLTKELKQLHDKIIECKYENDQWIYMRERTDKSFPNSHTTALSVCESIKSPVTKEILLDFINTKRFHDDCDIMPPPKLARR